MKTSGWLQNWNDNFKENSFRVKFPLTVFLLIFTIFLFTRFLKFNEARDGAVLNDPVLNLFNAIDLNTFIFILIYFSLVYGLTYLSFYPNMMMLAFQTYIIMSIFRVIAMYVTPLDPPEGTVDLLDPVVFAVGTGELVRKDLFFSGHTATVFIFFLWAKKDLNKILFLILTIAIGVSVLLQKAHYTIDVLAAPVFTFASYKIIQSFNKNILHAEKD